MYWRAPSFSASRTLSFSEVESVVDGDLRGEIGGVEGVELRLGLSQGDVHLAGLQHFVGMCGADAQVEAAVDDVLSEPEGEVGDAFLCLLVADGVVVDASCDA